MIAAPAALSSRSWFAGQDIQQEIAFGGFELAGRSWSTEPLEFVGGSVAFAYSVNDPVRFKYLVTQRIEGNQAFAYGVNTQIVDGTLRFRYRVFRRIHGGVGFQYRVFRRIEGEVPMEYETMSYSGGE